MTDTNPDIPAALAEAARAINAPQSLEETLDAIVQAASVSVPGFHHVGISIRQRDGRTETMAGTTQLVWKLDSMQYELDEGPCVQAMRDEPIVKAENIRHDQRWPRYAPAAADVGLRAQMAVQLYNEQGTLGGLNLYSTETDTIIGDAPRIAELFATHAALALGHARRESQLAEALGTRKVIGVAIGLVMARYEIDEERAFQFLVRASSTSNIKLRAIAEEVVELANRKYHVSPPQPGGEVST